MDWLAREPVTNWLSIAAGYVVGGGRIPFTRKPPAPVGGVIPDVPDDVAKKALRSPLLSVWPVLTWS